MMSRHRLSLANTTGSFAATSIREPFDIVSYRIGYNAFLLYRYVCIPLRTRFIIVGIILGTLVTIAFFAGSPQFGNFDQWY